MIKKNIVVEGQKNLSGAGNSRKIKELDNNLNTSSIVSKNTDYVKFGQVQNAQAVKVSTKNYGRNLIGDYVRTLDGSLYEDIRNSFSSNEDLLNYILYNRGGAFVSLCWRYKKDGVVGFGLDDLCQEVFKFTLEYVNKGKSKNGKVIDDKGNVVSNVLSHACTAIKGKIVNLNIRKNCECETSRKAQENIQKVRELLVKGYSIKEIKDELKLSDKLLDEILLMIRPSLSLDYEDKDGEALTFNSKYKVKEKGYESFEDRYDIAIERKSFIKIDNYKDLTDSEILGIQDIEMNSVDMSVIYLYRNNEIGYDYVDIYKVDRQLVLSTDEKKLDNMRFKNKALSEKYKCSSNNITKKREKLYKKLDEMRKRVQGGELLD